MVEEEGLGCGAEREEVRLERFEMGCEGDVGGDEGVEVGLG